MNQEFIDEFVYNSVAIERNPYTLSEVSKILREKKPINGRYLRQFYEVVNHINAFEYIDGCTREKIELTKERIKDIHQIIMANIMIGGIYRNHNVRIGGALHTPSPPAEMYYELECFYADLISKKRSMSPIEYSAWTQAEFVKIHPFPDGNGRTARLLSYYQQKIEGLKPTIIRSKDRMDYYSALDEYAINANLEPLISLLKERSHEEMER